MKKYFLLLLLIVGISSLASAEILLPANTLPQDKWGFEAVYLKDSNVYNSSTSSLTNYEVKAAYGLTDQLELNVAYGIGNWAGIPNWEVSRTSVAATLRYNLLAEANDSPATVTVAAGYKSIPVKIKVGTIEANFDWNNTKISLLVSKKIRMLTPYLGLSYNMLDMVGAGGKAPSTELTIGAALAWSKKWQLLVEYTSQAFSNYPYIGNFTSPQIGVGILYSFL